MAQFTVGPGKMYPTVRDAVAKVPSGATILVFPDANLYDQSFRVVGKDLTIKAIGASGSPIKVGETGSPPSPDGTKHWARLAGRGVWEFEKGKIHVEGFEFFGAYIGSSYNAAGIRTIRCDTTVVDCFIHNNQEGIKFTTAFDPATGHPLNHLLVRRSRFERNGSGTGLQHDIYVSGARTAIVDDCEFVDNDTGHHIKFNLDGGLGVVNNCRMPDSLDDPAYTHCSVDVAQGHTIISGSTMRKRPATNSEAYGPTRDPGHSFNNGKQLYYSPVRSTTNGNTISNFFAGQGVYTSYSVIGNDLTFQSPHPKPFIQCDLREYIDDVAGYIAHNILRGTAKNVASSSYRPIAPINGMNLGGNLHTASLTEPAGLFPLCNLYSRNDLKDYIEAVALWSGVNFPLQMYREVLQKVL